MVTDNAIREAISASVYICIFIGCDVKSYILINEYNTEEISQPSI